MNGGIAFGNATLAHPKAGQPAKDGHFEHLHDALGYGLVNVVPVADRPLALVDGGGLALHEVLDPDW
jgi:hypothetical protein